MAAYFLDSSAVVKRYVSEVGSSSMISLTDPRAGHDLHLAEITIAEVTSAIVRRQRAGDFTAEESAEALACFREDCRIQYGLVAISSDVIARAGELAERHFLRGYDAVQLGAALELWHRVRAAQMDFTFVCADGTLNTAAQQEGLSVMNPELVRAP
jgi:uncharacterized protein